MSEPTTICVLGLSDYLRRYALPGLMRADGCDLKAIAVRDPSKARRALGNAAIPVLSSFDEALARSDVQAIYIMLPNALHLEWIMRSIDAGKHVLCEKPMALSPDDVDTISHAAAAKKVHVMEGYMYYFHPQWSKLRSLLHEGTIGETKTVVGHYAYLDETLTPSRFGPDSGGGALRLVGCYAVGAARIAFGAEPYQAIGQARYYSSGENDLTCSGILSFMAGHALVHASVETFDTQYLRIMGTRGMIEMRMPWNPAANQETLITVTTDDGEEEHHIPPADQFQLEFEHFGRVVRGEEPPHVSLTESRLTTAAVEMLRSNALQREGVFPVG